VLYIASTIPLVIIATLITLHLLVSDINKTNLIPPVAHRGRYTFGEVKEIKRLHRELLPNSRRYKLFRALETVSLTLAGLMVVGFLGFMIYSKTEPPY